MFDKLRQLARQAASPPVDDSVIEGEQSRIKRLLYRYVNRETVLYIFFGIITTVVNFVVYYLLRHIDVNYLVANALAWVAAVVAAYITNKIWVFGSRTFSAKDILREIVLFAGARLLTLGAETAFLAFFVDVLHFNDRVMKVIAEVFVVIINYAFSKRVIFKKKEG